MLELSQYEELSEKPIGDLFSVLSSIDDKDGFNFPFTMKEIIDITFIGLNGGARKERKPEISKDETVYLLDDGDGVFIEVLNVFAAGISKAFSPKANEAGNAPSPKRRASKKQS